MCARFSPDSLLNAAVKGLTESKIEHKFKKDISEFMLMQSVRNGNACVVCVEMCEYV